MQIIEMTRNTVKRRGYDSRDHRAPRLTTIAKNCYRSLRNKGKDSICISFDSYYLVVWLKSLWKRYPLKSMGFPIDR